MLPVAASGGLLLLSCVPRQMHTAMLYSRGTAWHSVHTAFVGVADRLALVPENASSRES